MMRTKIGRLNWEIVFTAEFEDAEGVTRRSVITYRDIELTDVSDGVAAASAVGGADWTVPIVPGLVSEIVVRDLLIAGMGDSIAAGEGNPDRPVQLSISSRIQQALEHELLAAMTTYSAIGAAGVIMDIHTGEVLAMTQQHGGISRPTERLHAQLGPGRRNHHHRHGGADQRRTPNSSPRRIDCAVDRG